jgi:hypothetical protein
VTTLSDCDDITPFDGTKRKKKVTEIRAMSEIWAITVPYSTVHINDIMQAVFWILNDLVQTWLRNLPFSPDQLNNWQILRGGTVPYIMGRQQDF